MLNLEKTERRGTGIENYWSGQIEQLIFDRTDPTEKSGPGGARFSKAPETFRDRRAIFSLYPRRPGTCFQKGKK